MFVCPTYYIELLELHHLEEDMLQYVLGISLVLVQLPCHS